MRELTFEEIERVSGGYASPAGANNDQSGAMQPPGVQVVDSDDSGEKEPRKNRRVLTPDTEPLPIG